MTAALTTLALDHNFPEPILNALETFMVDIRLVPIRRIDQRLPDLDDRQLVDPWELFRNAAEHQQRSPAELYQEVAVSEEELYRQVLGG